MPRNFRRSRQRENLFVKWLGGRAVGNRRINEFSSKKPSRLKSRRSAVWMSSSGDMGIGAFFSKQNWLLGESFRFLFRQPYTTLLIWFGIGLSFALPLIFYLLVDNFSAVRSLRAASSSINVFLKVSVEDGRNLIPQIKNIEGVADVKYMSQQETLDEFRQWSGLDDVLAGLKKNPLPAVFLVRPRDDFSNRYALETIRTEIIALPEVASAEVDLVGVQRLQGLVNFLRRIILVVGFLLVLIPFMVVVYNVRFMIKERAEEIKVLKLIGATDAFVCTPFLYSGFLYGLGGGVFSWLIVVVSGLWLQGPAHELVALYEATSNLRILSWKESLALIAGAGLLGLCSAWWSFSHYIGNLKVESEY